MTNLEFAEELRKLYDQVFDVAVTDPDGKVGTAHLKGLLAVYEKGRQDAGS